MIRDGFFTRLARALEPDACADWLSGLRAAIAARPDASEEALAREATLLAAEADGWRRAMLAFDQADEQSAAADDLTDADFPHHQ